MSAVRDVAIVEAVRTPIGRGHPEKGIYRNVHPAELLAACFSAGLERISLDSGEVDNVLAGCVYQTAEQATGITRNAWLAAGLAESAGATTVDIRCGSGQHAVNLGAGRIAMGIDDVAVCGGVEHMGRVGFPVNEGAQEQWGRGFPPALLERYDLVNQGVAAERMADRWGVTRVEMDEFSLRSHQFAQRATEEGLFARELVPIEADGITHRADQGIRPDSSLDALAALPAAFEAGGSITAANSSQVSDGAAAVVLMEADRARAAGLPIRALIRDQVLLGVDPVAMLTGPIPATERILARSGMSIGDIDRFEINEAFASVVLAWASELGVDLDRVNRRGGAIAIGHPLGSTGARMLTTLLHTLEDEDRQFGLATMCCGGGLGIATLIERV